MKKLKTHRAPVPVVETPALPRWAWAERLGVLLLFALVAVKSLCPIYDQDLWFHMKGAQYMLRHGIPATDPFSYTASTHPWVSSGWLSSILLYALYSLMGPTGVILLVALTTAATLAILLRLWRQEGGSPYLAVVAGALVVIAGASRFRPRGDLFSMAMIAAFLLILLDYRRSRNPRLLLWLPTLSLLWANLHSGFVAGLLLIGLFLVGELPGALRRGPTSFREWAMALAALGASALATLANPYGLRIWTFGMAIGRSEQITRAIVEWLPLYKPPILGWPVLAALGLLLALGIVSQIQRRPLDLTALLWLGVFGLLAVLWRRQIVPFALVAMSVAAVAPRVNRREAVLRIASLAIVGALLAWSLVIGLRPGGSQGDRLGLGVDRSQIPLGAINFIQRNRLPGPMFNTYTIGGPLVWGCWPRLRVYIDGRADVYGDRFLLDYFRLLDHPEQLGPLLERDGIRLAVIGPPDPIDGVAAELSRLGWRLVYFEDSALVYLKDTPETHHLVGKLGYRLVNPVGTASLDPPPAGQEARLRSEAARALRESDNSVRALIAAGMSEMRLHENARAVGYLRRAVQEGPNWPEAHTMLAIALWESGEREEGLSHFEAAVRNRPEGGSEEINLGMALAELKRTGEADLHTARGYYLLARDAARRGQDEQALSALQECRKHDPPTARQALSDPEFGRLRGSPGFKTSVGTP